MSTQYSVNYSDHRFSQVDADKKVALSDLEQTYAGMINSADSYYNAQIDASKQWAEKQSELQQEQTDFAIDQIEQQKQQAQKDYTKEQSGAYVDWQKQSNQYGVNAEQRASAGLAGTGYAESSQVGMYNTYQNRVATARESFKQAIVSYNNAITEARLQNNATLAEIAYQALQQQLELSLEGFQYKNQLILDKASRKAEIEQTYYQRYMDVLNQINQENALAEEIRQYNASLAEEQRQYDASLEEEKRQFDAEMAAVEAQEDIDDDGYRIEKDQDNQELPVNEQSIRTLGYGHSLTAEELAVLVASGEVQAHEINGQLYFTRNANHSGAVGKGNTYLHTRE